MGKQESDRRLAEKDEEIDNARRNAARAVEQIQASLDNEMRSRGEAIRSRKKMESDFNDLEVQLATISRQAQDAQKQTKDRASNLKDVNQKLDDSQRTTEDLREQSAVSDRRVGLMSTEIEELRSALEQAERCRKQAENDLMEANERANMLHTQNTAFINQKRKIEGELNNVKNEVEEAVTEARNAEDAAKKSAYNCGFAFGRLEERARPVPASGANEEKSGKFGQRSSNAAGRGRASCAQGWQEGRAEIGSKVSRNRERTRSGTKTHWR